MPPCRCAEPGVINLLAKLRHRGFLTYFIFSAGTSAIGFVATVITIRLIPPAEFGRFALFYSVLFFVAPMVSMAADSLIAVNRAKLSRPEYEYFRKSYVTSAYVVFFFLQAVFLLLFSIDILEASIYLLIPIAALMKFLISIASFEYIIEEQSTRFGVMQLLTALLSLSLTAILLLVKSPTAETRIIAIVVADVVFLLVRYYGRMEILFIWVFDLFQMKKILRFGFPLLIAVVPAWGLNEADKVFIAHRLDLNAAGLYAAAAAISGFMITFNTALLNATLPKLYVALREHPDDTFALVRRFSVRYMQSAAAFAVSFALLYSVLSMFLLPDKYTAARDLVYLMIFFAIARSFYSISGAAADFLGMTVDKLKGITLGAVASATSMFIGLEYWGIAGVALGVGVGYMTLGGFLWASLARKKYS